MLSVILVEPEHASNVGACCRVMANFGVTELFILNPKCDCRHADAVMYAKHGKDVLDRAKVVHSWKQLPCKTLVATTAQVGTDYNIPRSPVNPKQLASMLPASASVGLVLGREGQGLHNAEIQLCDFVATIPAHKKYGTLNVSHSLAIFLYEWFVAKSEQTTTSHIVLATEVERKQLSGMLEETLSSLLFASDQKKETQRRVWHRMISRSFLTKREAFAVMGFFRKVLSRLSSEKNV